MNKSVNFSQFKALRRLSLNDFNRWLTVFYTEAFNHGVEHATKEQKREPDMTEEYDPITYEELRAVILTVPGVGGKRADMIIEKLEERYENNS